MQKDRDSSNHKRFGTRCLESERITGANGIDLSPLAAQLTYLRGILDKITGGTYQLLPSIYGVTAEEG